MAIGCHWMIMPTQYCVFRHRLNETVFNCQMLLIEHSGNPTTVLRAPCMQPLTLSWGSLHNREHHCGSSAHEHGSPRMAQSNTTCHSVLFCMLDPKHNWHTIKDECSRSKHKHRQNSILHLQSTEQRPSHEMAECLVWHNWKRNMEGHLWVATSGPLSTIIHCTIKGK